MYKTRKQLDEAIDELATWMPTMLAETDAISQMDAFSGRADLITEAASADDQQYVWNRLQRLLVEHCLIPAEEGPCS